MTAPLRFTAASAMNKPDAVSARDLECLRWYETRSNNGRGRITGASARLLNAGLLTRTHTGQLTWALMLSDKGRAALAKAKGQ